MAFLLTVALASSFITTLNSRPTQAESLLYTVGCVVKGILSTNCPKPTQPTPQQTPPPNQPQTTSPSDTTGSEQTPPPSNTNVAQPVNTPQPIELDQKLSSELPTIPKVGPQTLGSTGDGVTLPNTRGNENSFVGVLGARDTAPLQATSQGWNIVGVSWYWWLLMIGAGVGLYFWAKVFIDKLFAKVVNE